MSVITVTDGDPATEVIKLLLTHINAEAAFKRTKSSSKQTTSNGIQQLIQDIKKKWKRLEPEWTKFKAYTEAIPLLERLLLDYVYNIGDRSSRLLHRTAADVPKAPEDKMVTGLTGLINNIATQMDNKYVPASTHSVVKAFLLVYFPFASAVDNVVDLEWAEHLKSKKK
ncbi:uncharacterized protein LACBIDRAFT_329512 [Laccaria bicolor S238N-H82]|uniref:Predicted protein n=1 Tax=Laccaria bicolor (strain S238N-H82 / ATCC MYA-4686) TaxID=486041 RepID=B0DI99_LACBS|nr:uncharacterized protein LACBIDRAFT_329512 [Laccaria bicolor S238N-H82]EDR05645.1 predicted protein [Laccaria bicolor S238N-H82]|eukprot:XP_001883749.1 predicted protein [Laccaria bicolor S238N-H82]